MTNLYIFIGIVFVFAVIIVALKEKFEDSKEGKKAKYQYKKQNFFMTRAEHEFFDVLTKAVGADFLIFAQVHLPTLIDHKIKGQNWRGAFRHISEKSVDFVLCDKSYISPKLAIELDDKSHERPDRQTRDNEVERILKDAGLPLLRIENHGRFNQNEIYQQIKSKISL